MEELVKYIVSNLVENTDQISVVSEENDTSVTLRVNVAPEDMGKVIGKHGKIAQAIRTLVKTVGNKGDKKYFVQIGEEGAK